MAYPKRKPGEPKRPVPPELVGKGFDAHPENINPHPRGRPKNFDELRKLINEMSHEEIEIVIGRGKGKKTVKMTRLEQLLLEMFGSKIWQKQEMLLQYGYGKVPDKLEVSGDKIIHVTINGKNDDTNS